MTRGFFSLLPEGALGIVREVGRHLLRRPVVGIAAVARTTDGRYLLIRRGDTGTWALVGGTLEWGETMRAGLERELLEEAGVERFELGRIVGVYSKPDRDPRFHAVTVVVDCIIEAPTRKPMNPMEILEVGIFPRDAIPSDLAMGMSDMLRDSLAGGPATIE